MFVVDLLCREGHGFEGWFERSEDVRAQLDEGCLECPICGDRAIERRLGFRAVGGRRELPPPAQAPGALARADSASPAHQASPPQMPLEVQRALSALLRAVRTHGEDVGERFAQVARRIHAGDEDGRLVYGTTTPDEARELVDEGVPFAAIPVPEIDQN